MEAGNYSGEFLYFEDWDLFNRMLAIIGCKAWNIDHPLVAMRVSADFYGRRGGPAYLPHIWKSSRLHSSNADISPLVSSSGLYCASCGSVSGAQFSTFIHLYPSF